MPPKPVDALKTLTSFRPCSCPAEVLVDRHKMVRTIFVKTFTAEVQTIGDDHVAVHPARDAYPAGAFVTLTAAASPGWRSTGRTGSIAAEESPLSIDVDEDTGAASRTLGLRQVRPRPAAAPVIRYDTPAGHHAQVDFAEFEFAWGRRFALLVVLGYSRLLWLRFFERQDVRTLFSGLGEGFAYFGGVPNELLFVQMMAVITADLRLMGGQLIVNEEFLRFAAYWSFRPRACRQCRAQTKGKVERPIRYVRENFVYGRDFAGDGHLDEERLRWLERANARLHATLNEPRATGSSVMTPCATSLCFKTVPFARTLPPVDVKPTRSVGLPRVDVEKRPLSIYAAYAGGER